jgi:hypothetical protein
MNNFSAGKTLMEKKDDLTRLERLSVLLCNDKCFSKT